jgi:hypothetical protein
MNNHQEYIAMNLLKTKYANVTLAQVAEIEESGGPNIKNVCAKMHVEMVDRIESACALLNISKTDFIRHAVASYIDQVWDLEDEFSVLETIGAYTDE